MASKQVRTQLAIDIAMTQIPAGQPVKVVLRGMSGYATAQAATAGFGLLGSLLASRTSKDLYIVLTADWIAAVKASYWTTKPVELVAFGPRRAGAVREVKYGRGRGFSYATLHLPDADKPSRLRVHRVWRSDLEAFVAELNAPVSA